MAKTSDNSVKRDNQIKGSHLYYIGNANGNLRVLIFGNSITRHSPNEELGWSGDYGMAASKIENDYVHVLFSETEKQGKKPYFLVSQASQFEADFYKDNALDFLSAEKDFSPDVIILRLGDNVYPFDDESVFLSSFKKLIDTCKTERTKVIVTGSYFENRPIEPFLIKLCQKFGYKYVKIDDLSYDESNWGDALKFKHDGVRRHPGDKGMKEIAERIFLAVCEVL